MGVFMIHSEEKVKTLEVVTKQHNIHPDYMCDNYFAVAIDVDVDALKEKVRQSFGEMDEPLPRYVYMSQLDELDVGDKKVHYGLVCGVYGR